MKTYEVTVWPEEEKKPYTARYDAPTSIDALMRAVGAVRESGCTTAHVRLVTTDELITEATCDFLVTP